MVKERGNAVSRLNHSSSSSDVASSTQLKPVMEGLVRQLKALGYFRCSVRMQARKVKFLYLPPCNHVCPTNEWVLCYLSRQEQNTDSNGGKGK